MGDRKQPILGPAAAGLAVAFATPASELLAETTTHCHGPATACAIEPGPLPHAPEQKSEQKLPERPAVEAAPQSGDLPPGKQMFVQPQWRLDDTVHIAAREITMLRQRLAPLLAAQGDDYVSPASRLNPILYRR